MFDCIIEKLAQLRETFIQRQQDILVVPEAAIDWYEEMIADLVASVESYRNHSIQCENLIKDLVKIQQEPFPSGLTVGNDFQPIIKESQHG